VLYAKGVAAPSLRTAAGQISDARDSLDVARPFLCDQAVRLDELPFGIESKDVRWEASARYGGASTTGRQQGSPRLHRCDSGALLPDCAAGHFMVSFSPTDIEPEKRRAHREEGRAA
jgi:hypothetical protein